MNIEALKVFCDVVRSASFSRGAAENEKSQSTASTTVQQLEARLGVKLIDRSKRPFVPTPAGRVFYEGCREIWDRFLELEREVRALGDDKAIEGTVGVAAIYSVGFHHMSRYVRSFEERFTKAFARVEYLPPGRVLEAVRTGEVQLGILSCPKRWSDLTVIPWRDEPMVVAAAPGHRLASSTTALVRSLAGEPFIAFEKSLPIRRLIDRFLKQEHVEVDVQSELDSIEIIKRRLEVGDAISLLPRPCLDSEIKAGTLTAIPLENASGEELIRPLAIIHRRHPGLDRPTRAFLEILLGEAFPGAQAAERESGRALAGCATP